MNEEPDPITIDELEQSLIHAITKARTRYDIVTEQIENSLGQGRTAPSYLHEEQAYQAGWLHALEAVLKRLRGEQHSDPSPGEWPR